MQAGARSLLKASKADEMPVIKVAQNKVTARDVSYSPNRSPRKAKKDVVDLA